eukprot:TRINITY_DN21334_c2_g1_i1.p1 TRINITY_DN21334_c2_g1~~TRINITY_DN21334_c2_g1_i1.p1  ORF type:complete len:134 (+),score=16.00 TRINITY_DN21334_c2_g1_i1:471-872(+)
MARHAISDRRTVDAIRDEGGVFEIDLANRVEAAYVQRKLWTEYFRSSCYLTRTNRATGVCMSERAGSYLPLPLEVAAVTPSPSPPARRIVTSLLYEGTISVEKAEDKCAELHNLVLPTEAEQTFVNTFLTRVA